MEPKVVLDINVKFHLLNQNRILFWIFPLELRYSADLMELITDLSEIECRDIRQIVINTKTLHKSLHKYDMTEISP